MPKTFREMQTQWNRKKEYCNVRKNGNRIGCQPIYRSFVLCSRHRSALINVIWYAVVHLLMKHSTSFFHLSFCTACHHHHNRISYLWTQRKRYIEISSSVTLIDTYTNTTQNAYFNKCVRFLFTLPACLALSLSRPLPFVGLSFCSCGGSSKIHLQNISSSLYAHHKPHYYKPHSYHFLGTYPKPNFTNDNIW